MLKVMAQQLGWHVWQGGQWFDGVEYFSPAIHFSLLGLGVCVMLLKI